MIGGLDHPEFNSIVEEFHTRQKGWHVEHLWKMDKNGNKIAEYIGSRDRVASEFTNWNLIFPKKTNSIHNHPASDAIPSPNDLLIFSASGGVHYIVCNRSISEVSIGNPRRIWESWRLTHDWILMLAGLSELGMSSSYLKLEHPLVELLSRYSIGFCFRQMREPGSLL